MRGLEAKVPNSEWVRLLKFSVLGLTGAEYWVRGGSLPKEA